MDSGEQVARLLGLAATAALGVACFLVLQPFLSALLGAVILAFSTWPAFRFLTARLRLRPGWAAAVMVLLSFLVLALPLLFVAPVRREDVEGVREWIEQVLNEGPPDLSEFLRGIPMVGGWLAQAWQTMAGDGAPLVESLRPYAGDIAQTGLAVVRLVLSGLLELVLAILLAFFVYKDGPAMAAHAFRLLERLAGGRALRLWALTGEVTRGVVYGLLGTALAQGFTAAIGFWIAGVPQWVLLGVVSAVISILPFGAPMVWVPVSIWLLAEGSLGWALFLLAWGLVVISSVDNFIRPWLISRGSDLPLLLTLLGALGGVFAFGFLGLFLGPVLLAVGYALLLDWGRGRDGASPGPPPPV